MAPSPVLLVLAAAGPSVAAAFAGTSGPVATRRFFSGTTDTSAPSLSSAISLSMIFKPKDYDQTIENLMVEKGLTREEAVEDYDAYRENPTNYALNKGEEYYRSLGYKTLMDGVIGEAEKEGRGDEVRERIAAFKKKSQMKAAGFLAIAMGAFIYFSITNPYVPAGAQ